MSAYNYIMTIVPRLVVNWTDPFYFVEVVVTMFFKFNLNAS